MSGFVGDLSARQQSLLDQFRVNVKDVLQPEHDDYEVLRWLRARSWDLKKSEKMFRDHLIWQKEHDVAHLLDWDVPEVIRKYFPGGYFGEDKQGSPIWWDATMTADIKGMAYSSNREEVIKFKLYYAEYAFRILFKQQTKKHGRRIDAVSIVMDMKGLDSRFLWKPIGDLAIDLLKQLEGNYPETVGTIYVINAPKLFSVAFNLVKPFLSDHTKEKIRFCGKDWKVYLQKFIDADQIPVHWGGTAKGQDGDPCCGVVLGSEVPETYYKLKTLKESADMSEYTHINVKKGSTLQLDYDVEKPDSIIRWNFWTEGKDIGFGIFRRTTDQRQKAGEMDEVLPSKRVNSHMIPENGHVKCDMPGTYIIRFDNTYSWVNNKDVSYQIEVLETNVDDEHILVEVTSTDL